MLELITLHTIQMIFDSLEQKISEMSKIIYINCLIHHFKDKKATFQSSISFEIVDSDFDFNKFKKNFHELHKAGLVTINGSLIIFNNVWSVFIDVNKLVKEDDDIDSENKIKFIKPNKIKDELLNSDSLKEVCQMKYNLSKDRLNELIELFVKEQLVIGKTYSSQGDCTKHFIYWLYYNKDKTFNTEQKSTTQVVKSKGRLLGK
jgi:hypothetical protein